MNETEVKIIVAASDVITRNGVRGTSMSDFATAAEVSRQTLYAHFGNKKELLAAVYRHGAAAILTDLETQWDGCETVADLMDVFFNAAILEPFDLFRQHPDLMEFFEDRSGPQAGLISAARTQHSDALAKRFLQAGITGEVGGYEATQLAAYVVHVAKDLKISCESRAELELRLKILKSSVLTLISSR